MKISLKNRKIGYTYLSQSGVFSFKGNKEIAFESRLEKDFLTLFEFSENVLDIDSQPFTLEYTNEKGSKSIYTPDFLVSFRSTSPNPDAFVKSMVVEVKPREILRKDFSKFRYRFKQMISYCQSNDMIFKIYDESRIHTPYFHNITLLMRYRRYSYDPLEAENILSFVNARGQIPIGHLPAIFGGTDMDKAELLGHVHHLLAKKELCADLRFPINKDTEVWVNDVYSMQGGEL